MKVTPIRLDVRRDVLRNGITLLVSEKHDNPSIAIFGTIRAGGVLESDEKAGLSQFVARLIPRGTEKKAYQDIVEGVESIGATVNFRAFIERMQFSATCTTDSFPKIIRVIFDCLRNASFPVEEVEKVRGEIYTNLMQQEDSTRFMARREFFNLLYRKGHPYRRNPTGYRETISSISREDILDFHRSNYSPKTMILAVTGDVKTERAAKEVEEVSREWEVPEPPKIAMPQADRPRVSEKIVPMMHKSQADIVIGCTALRRTDEDFYALNLANQILGRLALMGRLGKKIRDEQGLAYYSYSDLEAGLHGGHWLAIAGVNPVNVDKAIKGIRLEIDRITSEPVSDIEISDGKKNQIGRLKLSLETTRSVARIIHDIEFYKLGLDYINRYPSIIEPLTKGELLQAAKKYIEPSRCVQVVAGPYKE